MARILIAWELGEAFGHLARCLRLAQGLMARGHGVTLVLKDVRLPTQQTLAPGATVLSAPLTPHARAGGSAPVNYADVLRVSGFADARDVAARLNAWRGLLSLVRPDVLVADHAPTALLAARLADVPNLSIGNGFAVPPAQSPWPSIRPWETVSDQTLTTAEARLDHVLAAAQKVLGHNRTVRVRELFGEHDILDTFAELDHCGARPNGRYVGPIVSVPQALRVTWQSREGPKVLAYLRPAVPGFTSILQALARLDAEVLCIAPGITPEMAKRHARKRLRIALTPIELPPLLAQADLAISYGNAGFGTQALLAGLPLLMRPRYVEQALFAHRVHALGAGQLLSGQIEADAVTAAVDELLTHSTYRQAARSFQSRHSDYTPSEAVGQTILFIERTVADGRNADRDRMSKELHKAPSACLR
ncbi:MAG TPA: UDP-glucuronosyltransferase [Anaerolineae bacterium]|nr:UDP-glucuronosyltransferase [Anaerolineae bacterium]